MGAGAGLAEGRGPALLRGEARCRSRQHPGLLGPGPGWTVFPFLPRLGGGGVPCLGGEGGREAALRGTPLGLSGVACRRWDAGAVPRPHMGFGSLVVSSPAPGTSCRFFCRGAARPSPLEEPRSCGEGRAWLDRAAPGWAGLSVAVL